MKTFFQTLRIEWMKVKHYRTFWILLAVIVVCIPAFNYVIFDLTDNSFPKMNGKSLLGTPFSFPDVWKTIPYNAGLLLFIPAILIITLTTNEFSFRTHRQNIIDGWSRGRFIGIKLFEAALLSVFVTLIVLLTCLYFGFHTLNGKAPAIGWQELRFVFFFFIEILSYSMIAFLLSMFIRRAGLAMGIFFLYMIVEQFVVALGRNKYKVSWVDYLPEETTDRLLPQPFLSRMVSSDKTATWEHHIPYYLLAAALYLILYTILASRIFQRKDL
jgi:hypothetical protein